MTTGSRRRSYRSGGWFGIFGEHATVLLPPSEKARVAALWELIDEGAGFDEVLDGLLASGLRELPGFVLVSETEQGTKVVLRGPAVAAFVSAGAMIELAGSSDTTWVERTLTDVTQMFVQVEPTDEDDSEDLVIGSGLVRLARVEEPPFRPEDLVDDFEDDSAEAYPAQVDADQADADPAADADGNDDATLDPPVVAPVAVLPVGAGDVLAAADEETVADATLAEEALPDEPAPEALADEMPVEDEPVEELPVEDAPVDDALAEVGAPREEPPLAGPALADVPVDEVPVDEVPVDEVPVDVPTALDGSSEEIPTEAFTEEAPTEDVPVVDAPLMEAPADPWSVAPAEPDAPVATEVLPVAPPPPIWQPAAPTAPMPYGAQDAPTSAGGWEIQEFDRPEPGIPGQPPAPAVTRPVARLLFSSGETIDVDRAILVGRAPEARRFASNDQPRLVPVPSPQQEISSTHLEVRPGSGADHGTAVVTDLGSTNGTVLVQPGLPPEELRPGIAVQLLPGAIIDLGDGVTIQVTNV